MKKEIKCTECGEMYNSEYICDTCGKKEELCFMIALRIDLDEYHFCSYQCLLQFIVAELKKEK